MATERTEMAQELEIARNRLVNGAGRILLLKRPKLFRVETENVGPSLSGRRPSMRAGGSGLPPPRPRPLVEFGIAAENARFIEGNPPVRGEIGGDARKRRDRSGQRGNRRIELAGIRERAREGVSQARPDLEQREVHGGEVAPDSMRWSGRIAGEHALEIAEVLWRPVLQKRRGARLGLFSLVLEVELGRDRMVRVVNLGHEIGDRELEPAGENAACLVLRRKAELGAEIVENVRDM